MTGDETPTRRVPIVGVGASAGGLEAFTELLKHLPTDTSLGFVLVQHLDPQHESALTEILARATSMPVREVTASVQVEANHVYVISPNTNLIIERGVLKPLRRPMTRTPARSIDSFFESLAQDQGERAIGVILSGSASDGTLGLEAIKAEGGITFAQDGSARYESMPRSAVAAGCVDFVLKPEDIAKELAHTAAHPYVAGSPTGLIAHRALATTPETDGSPLPLAGPGRAKDAHAEARAAGASPAEHEYQTMLLLLRNHSGVDFSFYKSTTIERRIARRMVLSKLHTVADYARLLEGNAKELDALYSDMLIGVTSFFRNPEAFDLLGRKVFPKLLQRRTHEPIRVWVLGCSTGQEAYSIAMTYAECADRAPRMRKLQVFATDLNESHLERARHGLYTKSLAHDVSPERLRRFFTEEDGGYRISKTLREMVVFARQNLIKDPPFSRMDLVSCRNLLIYLEPSVQKQAIPTFHYALRPEGFLLLGASESIGGYADLFAPVDRKHKIYVKKAAPTPKLHFPGEGRAGQAPAVRSSASSRQGADASEWLRGELNAQREADRITVSQFAPPGVIINAQLQVLQFRGPTGAYLQPPPTGKPSFDVLKMARDGLMLPLNAAIKKAKRENRAARKENVQVKQGGKTRGVDVDVIPLNNAGERCFLILFEDADSRARAIRGARPEGPVKDLRPGRRTGESSRVRELEREVSEMREYLHSIEEQHEAATAELQASSEEAQSANEELQSLNEEMETSKEELESTNEELTTVNDEMAHRNSELSLLYSDLVNLQNSTRLAFLLLGRDLTVRRFSAKAGQQFHLSAADAGRPLRNVRHNLAAIDLEGCVSDVVASVRATEQDVRDNEGHWFSLRVHPYLTVDNRVDGAVLILLDIDALKLSEQAIAEGREHAEAIIHTVPDPLVILSADLRVQSANDAFYRAFKLSPAGTEGRVLFELDGGSWNIPRLRQLLEDVIPRNSVFNDFEVAHTFERIGRRALLLNARMLHAAGGKPREILLGMRDITEVLEFQADLRRSEMRYRRLFESAQDGVLLVDATTRKIRDANPMMAELVGQTRAELRGMELSAIGLLGDRGAHDAALRRLQSDGHFHYDDLPLESKTGRRIAAEVTGSLYDEGSERVILINVRDISQRKQAEVERRRSEAWRRLLVDGVRDFAIVSLDQDGRITEWNFGATQMFGYTAEEILGEDVSVLFTPEDRAAGIPQAELRRAESAEVTLDERWHLRKNGERVFASGAVRPIYSDVGQLLGFVKMTRDITARKTGEDVLREAEAVPAGEATHLERLVAERTTELTATNRQMEAFVYSIAHDLRAPLRAMEGFSAMLLEEAGATLNDTGREYAGRINKSARYMDALLGDLLAFSQISQQRVELTVVDLEAVVDSVLARLQRETEATSARVERAGPWPTVLAHESTLAQVLINLLSNALKFVPEDVQPKVRLWAEERGEVVRVWVEDNGIGIAPRHQDQIFGLFTRLHGDQYAGTGIGLAIVQKGVERMGRRTGVESAPGRGSRFWFELRRA